MELGIYEGPHTANKPADNDRVAWPQHRINPGLLWPGSGGNCKTAAPASGARVSRKLMVQPFEGEPLGGARTRDCERRQPM